MARERRLFWFFAKNFGPSLIASIIAYVIFRVFPLDIPYSWIVELILEASVFAVVALIIFAIRIYQLRTPLSLLFSISQVAPQARGIMVKFLEKVLDESFTTMAQLRKPAGVVLSRDKAESVYKDCFEFGGRKYVGSDGNVPSVFFALYRDYLTAQEKYTSSKGSTRILVVAKDDLNHDYLVNSKAFMDLWGWHLRMGCELLQVDPNIARDIAEKNQLWTTDIGLWQDYALLFKPVNSGSEPRIKLSMVFKGEEQYQNVFKYYYAVLEKARGIEVRAGGIDLVSRDRSRQIIEAERGRAISGFQPDLARCWEDFVNCPKRLKTMKAFLKEVLEPYAGGRILDAATGTGCDSIELSKQGFYVVSNEIDYELAEIAYRNSRRELSEVLNLTKYDWRTIGESFKGNEFDAILVLGNSLCLLLNESDRKKCINQFVSILKKGGALIIDERNFLNILKHKKEFLKKGGFHYKKDVIYCGEVVHGYPIKISDKNEEVVPEKDQGIVIFEYAHHILGPVGTLKMYPFKSGELKLLLEDEGLKVTNVYWDLKKEKEYKKTYGEESPDFFTYIAIKQ
jgi:SAM-dependent methyltransferase